MSKKVAGLVLGAVIGFIIGSALVQSSLCIPSASGLFGCLGNPFAFLQLPFAIFFALIGWWLGGKIR
jgi:hypothetical protein